jgi:hypothetical protein
MGTQISSAIQFSKILDIIDALPMEEQEALVDIVKHRLTEQTRKQIIASVLEAREEYSQDRCRQVTVDQLRDEIY